MPLPPLYNVKNVLFKGSNDLVLSGTDISLLFRWVLEDKGPDNINQEAASFFVGFFLFLLGLFAGYPYYIPPAVFSVKFGGPDSGTVSALLDVVTSIVSASKQTFINEKGKAFFFTDKCNVEKYYCNKKLYLFIINFSIRIKDIKFLFLFLYSKR